MTSRKPARSGLLCAALAGAALILMVAGPALAKRARAVTVNIKNCTGRDGGRLFYSFNGADGSTTRHKHRKELMTGETSTLNCRGEGKGRCKIGIHGVVGTGEVPTYRVIKNVPRSHWYVLEAVDRANVYEIEPECGDRSKIIFNVYNCNSEKTLFCGLDKLYSGGKEYVRSRDKISKNTWFAMWCLKRNWSKGQCTLYVDDSKNKQCKFNNNNPNAFHVDGGDRLYVWRKKGKYYTSKTKPADCGSL